MIDNNDSLTSFASERNNDKDLTSDRKSLRKAQDDQQINETTEKVLILSTYKSQI